uniref:LOB domain-containing protein 31-like n=1 Tax=Erigeron canadensis TaxID=72917 RepID=UPI001CB95BFC|nr:LOB domain-containing protein 31-like [Erigeron canadensis]
MITSQHDGPCGACKLLRRKCVKNCVFAPYFDPDQAGTTHFAAVHKVFGASNASKLLLRVPPHRRLDAVVSLCFEALSRVRDPVYGCVANILTLQQQVVNLQTELSYVRAQVSMLQCHPQQQEYQSSMDISTLSPNKLTSSCSTIDEEAVKIEQMLLTTPTFCSNNDTLITSEDLDEESDLEMLAQAFLAKYQP